MKFSKSKESAFSFLFGICAFFSIFALVMICLFLLVQAFPAFMKIGLFQFLFGTVWDPSKNEFGILPMIAATILVSAIAMLEAVPLGAGCAAFIVFFCPGRWASLLKKGIDLLASVPSIVFGLFGMSVLVPIIQKISGTSGRGMLTAGILLAIMILPTIVSVSITSLKSVDPSWYEGSLALGASHEKSVYKVVFKGARNGMLCAGVLGLGRAVGETMAVVMVAGNAAVFPKNLFAGVRTLTANIVLEMGYAPEGIHRQALIATGAVLLALVLMINAGISRLQTRER